MPSYTYDAQILKVTSSSVLTVFICNSLKISKQITPNVTTITVSCNTNKSPYKRGSNQLQRHNLIACVQTPTSSTLSHTVTWIICVICYMSQSPPCVIMIRIDILDQVMDRSGIMKELMEKSLL